MTEAPEYILINVPANFFKDNKEEAFRRFYESMGKRDPNACFYHWISTIPVHKKNLQGVYVCFAGKVQYRAILVDFIKNGEPFEGWGIRNWMILTGPVVKAPENVIQMGFRGFRYCKQLF